MWNYKKGFFVFPSEVLKKPQKSPETEQPEKTEETQGTQPLVEEDIVYPEEFCLVCQRGIEDNFSTCPNCRKKFHTECGDTDPVSNQIYCSQKCISEVS